nr:hypothetical protein CFP56_01012 [Quercus suber]
MCYRLWSPVTAWTKVTEALISPVPVIVFVKGVKDGSGTKLLWMKSYQPRFLIARRYGDAPQRDMTPPHSL